MRKIERIAVFIACLATLIFTTQIASAQLTLTRTTWNTIGIDSNKPSTEGPDTVPVAVRVTNNGAMTATNVTATFIWDEFERTPYTQLNTGNAAEGTIVPPAQQGTIIFLGSAATFSFGDLAPGESQDFFFNVSMIRNKAFHFYSRNYHIEVSSNEFPTIQTSANFELWIANLLTQSRNSVDNFALTSGPTGPNGELFLGEDYTFTMNASTSTDFNEVTVWMNFPPDNFEYITEDVTFDVGQVDETTINQVWADACTWDNNPANLTTTYLQCLATGKIGGSNIRNVTTVRPFATGSFTVQNLIYDISGASFHYNADFDTPTPSNSIIVNLSDPGSIGDTVFQDNNENGVYDSGIDTPLSGVPVSLVEAGDDGVFGTGDDFVHPGQVTDAGGMYLFSLLTAGNYRVTVDDTMLGGLFLAPGFTNPRDVTLAEGENNLDVDFPYLSSPTYIELLDFTAFSGGAGQTVELTWETAAEIDNIGFNVYRATETGARLRTRALTTGEKLNDHIIPAEGNAFQGAVYTISDDVALSSAKEERGYFLEDIDVNGTKTVHGPFFMSIKSGSTVGNWIEFD